MKRRSFSIGLSSAGSGIGGIFWSFFIRAIIARMGYQWALRLSGIISAGINAFALCILKTRPFPPNSRQPSIWSGFVMFKDPKFVTLYCASCLSVFGYDFIGHPRSTKLIVSLDIWYHFSTYPHTHRRSYSRVPRSDLSFLPLWI